MPKKDDPHSWCISGNPDSEKYGEINVYKAAFQRTLRKGTWQMRWNSVPIGMAAPLQYLLNILKVVALGKVCFSNTQKRKTSC